MRTLRAITSEIKTLEKQERDIRKQINNLQKEYYQAKDAGLSKRVLKRFKPGHCYLRVEGLTNYHCDAAELYEIISQVNGSCFDARIIRLRYSDGEYWGSIAKDHVSFSHLDNIENIKEVSTDEANEYKEVIFNPETAEAWLKKYKE